MKKSSQTFDDHKMMQNPKSKGRDAECCCDKAALSEEELDQVSAAGDATVPTMNPEVLLGRHDIPADTRENNP